MPDTLLPPAQIHLVAQRFKMLSEPARLALLNQLQLTEEMTVQALVEATGQKQATVSKHLLMMANAGLLGRRKAGLHVYYCIIDPTLSNLCSLVCDQLRKETTEKYEAYHS